MAKKPLASLQKTKKRKPSNLCLFILCALVLSTGALAKHFIHINIDHKPNLVSLWGSVQISKLANLQAALKKGLTYSLSIAYKIKREANAWYKFDKTQLEGNVVVTLKYNQTNKSYLVHKDGQLKAFFTFKEAWQYASAYRYPLPKIKLAGAYTASVKVQGESIRLYFPLGYIYRNFVGDIDFSSSWNSKRFTIP